MKLQIDLLDELKPLFGNIKESYKIYDGFNISPVDQYLLAIHNSGDDRRIMSKLWNELKLNSYENLYVQSFQNTLKEIDRCASNKVYRYEINSPASRIERLFNTAEIGGTLTNSAFWNFTENHWPANDKKITVYLKKKTNCRSVNKHLGPSSHFEKK